MNDCTQFPDCTTEEILEILCDGSSVLVDARSSCEYMGWKLDGARGGHLPGAKDFSADWLRLGTADGWLRWDAEQKGLLSGTPLVVYASKQDDALLTARRLKEMGAGPVSLYDCTLWLAEEAKPLESYAHYDMLVPPETLWKLMRGEQTEIFSTTRTPLLFEVSWGEADQTDYAREHIPGAVHINSDWFEPEEGAWRLDSDENLLDLAARLGITQEDAVIVAGKDPAPNCRFAIILRYLGVRDVRVLAGGVDLWKLRGYPLSEKAEPAYLRVSDFGTDHPLRPEWILTIPQLQEKLSDPSFDLADTRSWEEYIGESTGYSYHLYKGHIPGAVFSYDGEAHSSDPGRYRNPDITPRNRELVQAMWEGAGLNLKHHLSFMCGGGWRAAEILWYARIFGMENTSLYSDGWCGWSNLGLPGLCGVPEK